MAIKIDSKKMEQFRAKFDKDFAGGLHDGNAIEKPTSISTGSIGLDDATCIGGYPEGRQVEIWGKDDIGKTTLALLGVAEAQKQYPDRYVVWVDVEDKLDKEWAVAHGVNLDRLWIYVPDTAEEAADAVTRFLEQNFVSMLIVDSIGAMISRVELEKDAGDATVAVVAKIVSRMVKAATSKAKVGSPVIIWINQIRASIGSYGITQDRPGGWALKFQTTMRIKLATTSKLAYKVKVGDDNIEVGREIMATVERNKCGPKGRSATITLIAVPTEKYGPIGVDQAEEALDIGIKRRVIKQGGAYYTLPNGEYIKSKDAVSEYLHDHPEEVANIRQLLIDTHISELTNDLGETDPEVEIEFVPDEPTVPRSKGAFKKGKVEAGE